MYLTQDQPGSPLTRIVLCTVPESPQVDDLRYLRKDDITKVQADFKAVQANRVRAAIRAARLLADPDADAAPPAMVGPIKPAAPEVAPPTATVAVAAAVAATASESVPDTTLVPAAHAPLAGTVTDEDTDTSGLTGPPTGPSVRPGHRPSPGSSRPEVEAASPAAALAAKGAAGVISGVSGSSERPSAITQLICSLPHAD